MKIKTNIIYSAFALFAFTCFALAPQARATCQDACLTNDNTVQGDDALISLTSGTDNTANGSSALFNNNIGIENTATGFQALYSNTTGSNNTASGYNALCNNTAGGSNIALGFQAGLNLSTGNNNIDIGNVGVAGESKTIRIGTTGTQRKAFIAGISGATIASGV